MNGLFLVKGICLRTKNKPKYERRLMKMLVNKYGEEPSFSASLSFKSRLIRFYDNYQPEKVSSVDKFVEKIGEDLAQQEQFFARLIEKYGPEPIAVATNNDARELVEAEEEAGILKKIMYCPIDGLPPEYSEFLPSFSEALPWLYENCPNLKLTTQEGRTVAEFYESMKEDGNLDELEKPSKSHRGGAARPNKSLTQAKGKKSKGGTTMILIEKIKRGNRKYITQVTGLEQIEGIKLKEAAKKLGKRFACSASVNKLPDGTQSIDIQGDCSYELPGIIIEFFPSIQKEMVYMKDGGKKTKVFA